MGSGDGHRLAISRSRFQNLGMMDGSLEPDIIPEAASKKPRGRPRIIPAEEMRRNRSMFPDLKSDRQHQNRSYANQAMNILGLTWDEPPLDLTWLCDRPAIMAGTSNTIKWSILAELGRLAAAGFADADIVAVARVICEQRPTVKEAAAMVRRYRLQKPTAGSGKALFDRLIKCFNSYCAEHPDIPTADLRRTADVFRDLVFHSTAEPPSA
jgi:hypothetical protein